MIRTNWVSSIARNGTGTYTDRQTDRHTETDSYTKRVHITLCKVYRLS